jgi:hypothetical protein
MAVKLNTSENGNVTVTVDVSRSKPSAVMGKLGSGKLIGSQSGMGSVNGFMVNVYTPGAVGDIGVKDSSGKEIGFQVHAESVKVRTGGTVGDSAVKEKSGNVIGSQDQGVSVIVGNEGHVISACPPGPSYWPIGIPK